MIFLRPRVHTIRCPLSIARSSLPCTSQPFNFSPSGARQSYCRKKNPKRKIIILFKTVSRVSYFFLHFHREDFSIHFPKKKVNSPVESHNENRERETIMVGWVNDVKDEEKTTGNGNGREIGIGKLKAKVFSLTL